MNRRLADQFQSIQLPETIEEVLHRGTATCAEFNPWGTLLAAGGATGEVIIWDFETKGVARASQPHDQAVTAVAWTRDGRHVISASEDCTVSSLSILDNKQIAKMEVRAEPVAISVNREKPWQVLVSFKEGPPALLDLSKSATTDVPCVPTDNELRKVSRSSLSGVNTVSAVFGKDGRFIYIGQSKGFLSILDTNSLQFLDVLKLPSQPRILSVKLDRKGKTLLANCSDRIIRWAMVSSPPAQELPAPFSAEESLGRARLPAKQEDGSAQKLGLLTMTKQELHNNTVERRAWQAAAFSHDSEHLAGVTAEHKVYVWSLHSGKLEKFLEFDRTSDDCLHMSWHPQRSCFVTVGTSGKIYVWAQVYKENWSAFAPDFQELVENQEYVEREDEFDVNPRSPERPPTLEASEDVEVDVVTADPVEALYYSTDEDPATAPPRLHHLPLEIEPERPSTPERNADEDADEEEDESGDVNAVSISPKHVQDLHVQPQDHTDHAGASDGKRKRTPIRSRSRSYDEEQEEHQAGGGSISRWDRFDGSAHAVRNEWAKRPATTPACSPAGSRQKGVDGSSQHNKIVLSGLHALNVPHDKF